MISIQIQILLDSVCFSWCSFLFVYSFLFFFIAIFFSFIAICFLFLWIFFRRLIREAEAFEADRETSEVIHTLYHHSIIHTLYRTVSYHITFIILYGTKLYFIILNGIKLYFIICHKYKFYDTVWYYFTYFNYVISHHMALCIIIITISLFRSLSSFLYY